MNFSLGMDRRTFSPSHQASSRAAGLIARSVARSQGVLPILLAPGEDWGNTPLQQIRPQTAEAFRSSPSPPSEERAGKASWGGILLFTRARNPTSKALVEYKRSPSVHL
jgi:hypothetical protein